MFTTVCKEKFHLHIDFFEEDMDVDLNATQQQISYAIAHLADSLSPEMLNGVVVGLSRLVQLKESVN